MDIRLHRLVQNIYFVGVAEQKKLYWFQRVFNSQKIINNTRETKQPIWLDFKTMFF